MAEKIELKAIKSLVDYIDNRDSPEDDVVLDSDNAEFVADILRQHYQMLSEENKMEQVAKLLGQKINNRFTVEYVDTKFDCKFYRSVNGKCGFTVLDEPEFSFCFTEQILYALITGQAVIIDE